MEEIEILETKPRKGWNHKWTKHSTHRDYWKWKPWMRTDMGVPLKKKWRKKWTTYIKKAQVDLEVWQIVNYLTYWKSKIENPINIKDKLKPNKPMTVVQACRELWIWTKTFYTHLSRFPDINEKYQELKASRREFLKESAEANIEKALTWWMAITDKDVLDASFKMLEKTDKNYNPKIEIESKSISINLNKSSDDIINDLSSILWF